MSTAIPQIVALALQIALRICIILFGTHLGSTNSLVLYNKAIWGALSSGDVGHLVLVVVVYELGIHVLLGSLGIYYYAYYEPIIFWIPLVPIMAMSLKAHSKLLPRYLKLSDARAAIPARSAGESLDTNSQALKAAYQAEIDSQWASVQDLLFNAAMTATGLGLLANIDTLVPALANGITPEGRE